MIETRYGFFIELNNNISTLEGAELDIGNPGVGGTQYLFLITVKYLNMMYGDGYAVLLTNARFESLDKGIPCAFVEDTAAAIEYCEQRGIANIVFNANIVDRLSSKECKTNVNIILWAHNTLSDKRQKFAAMTESVKWVVCVSESQYKNMYDTPCYSKCTYINNIIPRGFYENATITDYSENKVVYIGSIMPQKGVHNLIEIWRHVERQCPKAQLYIFGGANVWNANAILGRSGVADPYYDKVIQKRLRKIEHLENIHFMGAKGWEYIDKFISTFRLGIVNPSHYMRDETFCLSAIEMAAHGLPIVSRNRDDGLLTTIIQGKTGYIEKTDREIADRIVSVILDSSLASELGKAGRCHAANFIAEEVISRWGQLDRGLLEHGELIESKKISRDTKLLKHDFALKIGFLVESGKMMDKLKKMCKLM